MIEICHPVHEKIFNDHFRKILAALMVSLLLISCSEKEAEQQEGLSDTGTPLDAYVQLPDPSFRSEVMYQSKKDGYTYYVLKMVSQQWLTGQDVDHPEWWHWVKVVIPDSVKHDTALLWIGGGDSGDELPQDAGMLLTRTAKLTRSVTAEVHNIPNQPLVFKGDTIPGRYEDELIAFGWRKFLEGGARDDEAIWLARLPMTKAVVRAMDAVEDLVLTETSREIENYVVSGASKRGWTTWTTAAVDDRVVAIVPVVIDLLNVVPSFEHHWKNYGFWAPAVGDYVNENIMDWIRSMEFRRLLEVTEPYSYIERYDLPKLLINAAGDQFFQPDSWQFYWDELPEEKHLRYVPNTGHSLRGTDALETLMAFYHSILEKNDRPDYSWEISDNEIRVRTDPANAPEAVRLWQAVNENSRDFRIDQVGEIWKDSLIAVNPDGIYRVVITRPEKGWKGYFVELTYPGIPPLKVTTGITVLPKVYPFEPFENTDAKGTQVLP